MISRCAKFFLIFIFASLFILYFLFLNFWQTNLTAFFLCTLGILIIGFILIFKIVKCEVEPVVDGLNQLKYRENLILNSIREGVCYVNENGNIIFVNRSAKYILGYLEDEELIGKNFHQLVHKNETKEKCAVDITIKNGTCNIFRNEIFYKKDGTPIQVAVFTSPIIEKGEIKGAVITFIDLTFELQQQQKIKIYQTIIEQATVVIVITDKDGNITYVNPSFEKVTGYSKEEAIGKNPRILKSGKHPKSFYENLWNTILSGNTWEGEFINKKKDGSLYFEEAIIFPLKDSKGNIINFVAIKKDITKTKELEEQLIQAQKLEAIGLLTGGIAHDFNNILTILSGYTEILENTINKEDVRYNYIQKLKVAIDRASNLVNKLLAFSRKQQISPKPLNIVSEIKALEKVLKRLIPEDITLKFIYKQDSLIVYADSTQLEQILINLIINAKDAIYEKKDDKIKTIEVILDKKTIENKEYVEIIVKDSGIGIPKNIKKKIFDPFFTTKKPGVGTGLGLSTVYGIVMQNNGKIKVESEYKKGSEFKIYLPLFDENIINGDINIYDKNIEEIKGKGKILIVEDEKDIRKVLKESLTKLGYNIKVAGNGVEALQILEKNNFNFDLIISDIIMPEMDGYDFYKELQKIKPDIKFLFISGYTDDTLSEKGIKINKINFLKKPFTIPEISKKIQELLS